MEMETDSIQDKLYYAISKKGSDKHIIDLISKIPDINAPYTVKSKDAYMMTCSTTLLELAVRFNKEKIVDLLLSHSSMDISQDEYLFHPFTKAVLKHYFVIADLFIQHGYNINGKKINQDKKYNSDNEYTSILCYIIKYGDLESVQYLFNSGYFMNTDKVYDYYSIVPDDYSGKTIKMCDFEFSVISAIGLRKENIAIFLLNSFNQDKYDLLIKYACEYRIESIINIIMSKFPDKLSSII